MPDFESIYNRAKFGPLSETEVAEVARELETSEHGADPYMLIQTLGRAGARQHRKLVEPYLLCRKDPMLARAAVETLCQDWGLYEEYLSELKAFVAGVAWDDGDDVRLMALACAGEYLQKECDPVLLELLLETFEDDAEDEILRGEAYSALAVAAGREIREIVNESELDLSVVGTTLEAALLPACFIELPD